MVIKGKGEAGVITARLMFPLYFRATNKHCDLAVMGEEGGPGVGGCTTYSPPYVTHLIKREEKVEWSGGYEGVGGRLGLLTNFLWFLFIRNCKKKYKDTIMYVVEDTVDSLIC